MNTYSQEDSDDSLLLPIASPAHLQHTSITSTEGAGWKRWHCSEWSRSDIQRCLIVCVLVLLSAVLAVALSIWHMLSVQLHGGGVKAVAVDERQLLTQSTTCPALPLQNVTCTCVLPATPPPTEDAFSLAPAPAFDEFTRLAHSVRTSSEFQALGIATGFGGGDNAVIRYLSVHGRESVLRSSGAGVCSRRFLFVRCCGTNYGTSVIVVTSALKTALMLNRTLVLDIPPTTLQYSNGAGFFEWPLISGLELERHMFIHGCDLLPILIDDKRTAKFSLGYLNDEEDQKRFMSGQDNACEQIITENDRTEHAPWWHMRCGTAPVEWPQILHFGPGEPFHFTDLLWRNTHWRRSPEAAASGLVASSEQPPHLHEMIWASAVRLSPSLQWVLHQFFGGAPQQLDGSTDLDSVVHLRSPVSVFVNAVRRYILANWDSWGRSRWSEQPDAPLAPNVTDTAEAEKIRTYAVPAPKRAVGTLRRREFRVHVTAAVWKPFGPVEWCAALHASVSPLLPSLRLRCMYFDAAAFVSLHGLPPDVSLAQVEPHENDWGVEPQWAALINVWAAQYIDREVGRIHCFSESNYGAIMRQVATMAIGQRVETYGSKGQINDNRGRFWQF